MSLPLHPRRAKYTRFWERRKAAQLRLDIGVLAGEKVLADRPLWVDYFPWAPGTIAEKMLFAELARRRVTFFFGPYWGDMPFTKGKYERYRPDFILPEFRIVIEIYGTYWHTQEGSSRRDARKAAMYTAAGYTYYFLWDYQVYASAREALDTIPELINPSIRTGMIFLSDRPFDPTAALRAARRAHPKVVRTQERGRGARVLAQRELKLRSPKRLPTGRAAGFEGLDDKYLAELEEYGVEWKRYVKGLGEYFKKHPELKDVYKKQYRYYLRWKNWWKKWQIAVNITPQWRDYIKDLGKYFRKYPWAYYQYTAEYYRWISWRRVAYRRR